ncbi:PilZ domain-containing protein [Amantichitinum ursilacus]|uniref:PilZ domain protein n=1 Tax=Amantichitinum ursilacus TaxID=857265 RepID=A0A0N0XH21_9NEIS|nr:PilZ domain-containing protein [Amantichitinum ursilacus]KPC49107.1 PilZ domain protein [Amantichitinum ursilacus]
MAEQPARTGTTRPGVLSLNIKEKAALYASYMPFVKGGGIFIPTNKPYRLGDEVFMLLSLLDDPAKIAVSGHVIWLTPQGAHNNHQQGIGVQFSSNEAGSQARSKIEALLGGYLQSARTTHTM